MVLSEPVQKRINKNMDRFKPADVLYREYQANGFKDIEFKNYDDATDETKRLIKFVELIKNQQMSFDDLSIEDKTKLAELITNV